MSAVPEVLFEDEVLLAVNKPPRLAVHPTRDPARPSLQSTVEEWAGKRLTLFHRLDADTTGVVLFGKDRGINPAMAAQFEQRQLRKVYWAVVRGRWRPAWNRVATRIRWAGQGRWRNATEGGEEAVSSFRVLIASDDRSWLEVLPKTGRTHQIRLHCLAHRCPILGDRTYGEAGSEDPPMALHARQLVFCHPRTSDPIRIVAEPPSYWREHWLRGMVEEGGWDLSEPGRSRG